LSFDSNSGCCAVAHAEGLKVFPALNATDRRWLTKLSDGQPGGFDFPPRLFGSGKPSAVNTRDPFQDNNILDSLESD
jgi:hypothetical protein